MTPWIASRQAPLSFTISQSLLKFTSIESVMLANRLILCRPFILLLSVFPSIRIFSNQSALRITWPKYWSFSISPSNEYSGLTSFRTDWFDHLATQGTLKILTCFMEFFEKERWGNPLVAQGLGLQAPTAAGTGAGTIPGLGLRPESCTTARSIERGQLPVSRPRLFSPASSREASERFFYRRAMTIP